MYQCRLLQIFTAKLTEGGFSRLLYAHTMYVQPLIRFFSTKNYRFIHRIECMICTTCYFQKMQPSLNFVEHYLILVGYAMIFMNHPLMQFSKLVAYFVHYRARFLGAQKRGPCTCSTFKASIECVCLELQTWLKFLSIQSYIYSGTMLRLKRDTNH